MGAKTPQWETDKSLQQITLRKLDVHMQKNGGGLLRLF